MFGKKKQSKGHNSETKYTLYKLVCQFLFPCWDCPSFLAASKTVRLILLPIETTIHEKLLPTETVHLILSPSESHRRKKIHAVSLSRKPFIMGSSLEREEAGFRVG